MRILSFLLQPRYGEKIDEFTISRSLKAAEEIPCYARKMVQVFIVKLGFSNFTVLITALMSLAIKENSDLKEARNLFEELTNRDVVSWTSLIVGYAHRGFYRESLDVFSRMIFSKISPNSYSYSGALSACSGLRSLSNGREIHARLLKKSTHHGIEPVLYNNLLNLYSRCRDLSSSEKLFHSVNKKDIIAWNEMISCYLQCGQAGASLSLFSRMISNGINPDNFTYAIAVDSCGFIASLRQGIQLHAGIIKRGFHSDIIVGNAVVDMYAKCGCMGDSTLVFEEFSFKDAVLWTTMVAGYARSGSAAEALTLFERMQELRMKPDDVTFLAVLSACSHGGLVRRGWEIFRLMKERYGISPKAEHYSCLVDLLCRKGHLEEASVLMEKMSPTASMRTSFLNACRLRGCDGVGFAAGGLLEGNLVALSNVLAAQSEWEESGEIRGRMKEEKVKKEPGCSWVETEDGLHVFVAESRSHPEMDCILQTLDGLRWSIM